MAATKRRKRAERKALWFRYRKCDTRRYRREMNALASADPRFMSLWRAASRGDDVARQVMADLADEMGSEYIARFLREMMFCGTRTELRKQRKKDSR